MNKRVNVTDEDRERLLSLFEEFHQLEPWSKVKDVKDFTVRRFELGYVNDIMCCEMTEEARRRICESEEEYHSIVVKFLPDSDEDVFKIDRVEQTATNAMISALGLAPPLIFAKQNCFVNQYIKCRPYGYEDDCDEETVKYVARILAKLHSLRTPVSNKGAQLWNEMWDSVLADPVISSKEHLKQLKTNEKYRDEYYFDLEKFDIIGLYKELKSLIEQVNSPVVLAHADFNRGNRIVEEGADENGKPTKRVYMVDLDYVNFQPRGIDLGRYFSNYRHKEDMFGDEGFPTDEEMKLFLEEYRQESGRLSSQKNYLQDPVNSIENLILESKVFIQQSCFVDAWFGIFMYLQNLDNEQTKHFLDMFKKRFSAVCRIRKQLIQEGKLQFLELNSS